MKALQLSTLAACLLLFAVSCTKTVDTLSSSSTSTTSSQNSVLGAKGGGQASEQGNPNDNPGNSNPGGGNPNTDKKPVLTPSQTSGQGYTNEPVTIAYTATDAVTLAQVGCGNISIYQLKDGLWVEVAKANAPTVTYTFTPNTAEDCAYQFKAGFNPGAGNDANKCGGDYAGVGYDTQNAFCADVKDRCVQTFTINGSATAVPVGNGNYEFTVTYELTSPVDVTGIKFQGGATAGGHFEHELTSKGDFSVVNANLQNTVLKWEGDLTACQKRTLTFKYVRKFSCPATNAVITGDWTAKKGETLLADPVHVTYTCN